MSIGYIFGGSTAGKTDYILNEIVRQEPGKNLIYIVPEQFSLQSERNLISRLSSGATINAQVLSFRRLAHHVFSETGGKSGYFDDVGKTMLLRRLLYELKDGLKFFIKSADKQGFMEQLSEAVSEFYQYGITPEKLRAYGEVARGSLKNKLRDLALIYEAYVDYLEGRYIPTDGMLDVLASRICDSKRLEGALVWISGFHGFTPQEYNVLGGLMKKAARITIGLTVKSSANRFELNPSDPFFDTKKTVNRLTKMAAELNMAVDEPVFLDSAQGIPADLRFLEKNLLGRGTYPSPPENISICRADNHYSEIHQVAAEITDLVRDGGYSYGDIAVLMGSIPTYERDLRNIFAMYDIPVFIDVKSDVISHPLVEAIRAALDIIVTNWSYESVFRLLKTGMTALTRDEVDNLENYVLAYGIRGNRWLMERWEYGFENNSRFNRDEIHQSKEYCQEILIPLTAGKRPVKDISADVFKFLEHLNISETLQQMTDEMQDQEFIRRNNQIWGKVCKVFDTLTDILGDEPVGIQEFAKILEAGFKMTDMGIIPTAQIQVIAGDVERSRLPWVKAMFVIGANEGILPSLREDHSLIDDEERKLLDPNAEELAPGGRRRGYEQQFLIYQAISVPSRRLYLSYSTGKINGRPMQPSGLISRIKKLYPLLKEEEPDYGGRITLARPMFSRLGMTLRETGPDSRIYGWFEQSPEYAPKLKIMKSILSEKIGAEALSPASADKLYGDVFSLNVSKLERYVQCPYAYFIRHNIGALERKIYEVQSVEIGNLYHDVLEMFTNKLKAQGISWRALEKPDISQGVDECISEIAPRLGSEVLLSTSRYKYVVKQASRVLKKSIWALAEHIKSGMFEILGTELEFGIDCPVREIVLELSNGRRLILHGRIDRVDVMDFDGKRYVKVIDYKSGNNKFDLSEIYFGTQLQLMLYMDAFMRSGAEMKAMPGGVFYFNLNDPLVDYGEKTFEQLDDEILRSFKMSGLALANTDILRAIDANIGRSSKIIPAAVNTKGEPGGSSVADVDKFNALREQVREKIKELGEKMTSGNINVLPYKKGTLTGCTYCRYGAVCRFQKEKYNLVGRT